MGGGSLKGELKKESLGYMKAYEFYSLDPLEGYQILGVLPERRKNPLRITQKSIMNWGKIFFGNKLDINEIFFVEVTLDGNKDGIFQPIPFFGTKEKM